MPELVTTAIVTSLISAIVGAAVGAIVSQIRTVKKHSDDERKDAADMRELLLQNTKMTCRLVIYSDKFSIDEKLDAYKVYSGNGWNHQTKTYMDKQVGCDVDEYIERHGI
ncbi:MAG: hypothetical protein IJ111_05715 [Eggerthellaceae bacterium]|nr:hypothetical protein [Eggerthellaceae bacterium]